MGPFMHQTKTSFWKSDQNWWFWNFDLNLSNFKC